MRRMPAYGILAVVSAIFFATTSRSSAFQSTHISQALPSRVRRLPPTERSTYLSESAGTSPAIHQDQDGNCVFGQKSYWDAMYSANNTDIDGRPSDAYSWYCGYSELAPFWSMLVPDKASRVLIAGIGNDPSPVDMFDAGYTDMIAFDYPTDGVQRAKAIFGPQRGQSAKLIVADARDLPLDDASVDATLDKGTLDAIYITGKDAFVDSVKELTRVTAPGGVVVCISRVIYPSELMDEFDNGYWDIVHDGTLAFAPDGEASIDLGAELYSWKRIKQPYFNEGVAASCNRTTPLPTCSVFIATSQDGFIADSNGSVDWLNELQQSHPLPEGDDGGFGDFLSSVDAIIMGRTTFDSVQSFLDMGTAEWPYGNTPVYVLTSNLNNVKVPESQKDKVTAITGHPRAVLEIVSGVTDAKNVYVDGGATIRSFLDAGLIRRAFVTTVPVKLGSGSILFTDAQKNMMKEVSKEELTNGFIKTT